MRAWGRRRAGASGGAAAGRAGGAGRARPSAAGRSRAAAGSETCRAPLPQPPRLLARPTDPRGPAEPSRLSGQSKQRCPGSFSRNRGSAESPGPRAGDGEVAAAATRWSRCLPRAGESWRITGQSRELTKWALPSGTGRGGSAGPEPRATRVGLPEPV